MKRPEPDVVGTAATRDASRAAARTAEGRQRASRPAARVDRLLAALNTLFELIDVQASVEGPVAPVIAEGPNWSDGWRD